MGRIAAVVVLAMLLSACTRGGFGAPLTPAPADATRDHAARDGSDGPPPDTAPGGDTQVDGDGARAVRTLVVAIEGTRASYVRRIRLSLAPLGAEVDGAPLLLAQIAGSAVRSLARLVDGTLVAGSGSSAIAQHIDGQARALLGPFPFDSEAAATPTLHVNSVHGLCTLPGGSVIAGEYDGAPGAAIAQFATGGVTKGATYVAPVMSTSLAAGTLSNCRAPADGVVYLSELDANSDLDGDVVRLVREATGWTPASRLDMSALDARLGTSHSAASAFVVHQNGSLYVFPERRFGSQIKRLIRCATPDISQQGCTLLGLLPTDRSSQPNGPDLINDALQIPGTDDLLFITNSGLYAYHLATDQTELLLDLAFKDLSDGGTTNDPVKQIRALVVL